MKKIIYLFIAFVIFACAKEEKAQPPRASVSAEEALLQAQPLYKAKGCSKLQSLADKRHCADIKLTEELQNIISKHQESNKDLKNAKMIVEFDIETTGNVSNIKVKKKVDNELDKAIAKFISDSKWTPAFYEGEKRKITRRLPIYIK